MSPLDLLSGSSALTNAALPLGLVIYLLLVVDARRKDSPSAGDDQLGVKTVSAVLIVAGVGLSAMGLQKIIHLLLTFSNFGIRIKSALPDLGVGIVAVIAALFVLLPKTNVAEYPKVKRLAAGAIALPSAVLTLSMLAALLGNVLNWSSWDSFAAALSGTIVAVAYFGASLAALAKLSGLAVPDLATSVAQQPPAGQAAHNPALAAQQAAHAQQQPQYQAPAGAAPGYPQPQGQPGYPQQQGQGGWPGQGQPGGQ